MTAPKPPGGRRRPPTERRSDGTFGEEDPAAPPRRRGNPAWAKGVSGNPGGKPKAIKIIQDRIGELTKDGQDILKFFYEAMQGRDAGADDPKVRLAAAEWLGAHYFGRPKQELGVTVGVTLEQSAMLEALKLSPHERRNRIAALKARALTAEALPAPLPDADTD